MTPPRAARTQVRVTDHAVLRYLEREHGLDVEAVRAGLAATAGAGARLGANAVHVGRVKIVLINSGRLSDGTPLVDATTVLLRRMNAVLDNGGRDE